MSHTTGAGAGTRSYDVYFVAGGRRFYFTNPNHGVILGPERISWTCDGRADEAPLANIAAIRLQSGGDWRNVINQCEIRFADGDALTVTNANSRGLPDDAQTPTYRAFVRDLHQRLAALTHSSVRFEAGYTEGRYRVVLVCAILLGIIGVGIPLVLWPITGDIQVLYLTAGGGFLLWPLVRMLQANAPRSYRPNEIPEDLMP